MTIDMAKAKRVDKKGWDIYKRLLAYVRPHRFVFIISLIGYAIFSMTGVATAEWLGWTVDQVTAKNPDARNISAILCVVIVVVRGIGGFMGGYSLEYIANHIVHKLRCDIMTQLLDLPVRYYDNSTAGRLVSKVTYDVAQISGAATNAVTVIFREGLTVVGLLAALFWSNWRLSLVFLLMAPCVALVVSLASSKFRRYSAQMQNSMGDVTQITNESIKGQRVVRTFNARDYVLARFGRASERNRRQNMKMVGTQAVAIPTIQLLVSLAMAVLIWFAMSPEIFASATAGDFVTFLTIAGLLAKPIRQLSQINSVIQRGISAADSIFSLLDETKEKDTGTHEVKRVQGEVQFEDVSFSYKEGEAVLSHINLHVKPGQSVALVGKSGSGKSTLVSLLPRFYDVDSGVLKIDGVPVQDYTLRNLREQIAVVSQDVVLFEGTVAENIAYGSEGTVSDDDIIAVAKNAHAMEFIEKLDNGIHSIVGDAGLMLSGGQRQRVAIARAFLKDAPILVLDEATSALDSESEQHIQQALSTLMQGRTTFVIAHRLSTIENANLILVMDKGRIVESGTHQELLALRGHYAGLHRIQFSEPMQDS
ncbi:MAG: lipid A export permease/ATP-binding protein MsbA [Gammaproteobacteria bacterium RIFCSPLOWO2_02_FULL_57_10]|nr:MAG: lipid A export permease/ATP-binding protein MsbA [Gammaproteobacteria bacterium RIFCSPLOWO2_02_FULL_57_10]